MTQETEVQGSEWRVISITMLQGWRDRLREAIRMLDMPLDGITTDATSVTAYVNTTRTVSQVEDAVRAQLQFQGWMNVEEEVE